VVFNIFTGTYDGQVSISNTISGLGESNTLTFQNAPGESPIITCIGTPTGRGFWIYKADYVTIQGLEIANCNADGIYFVGTTSDSATHNRAVGNYIHDIGSGFSAIFVQRAADCEIVGNEITNAPTGIYCAMGRGNLIANNMVYETTTAGLWSYYGLDDSFYYNSVYTDTLKALLVRQSTNPIIENNILFQNGTGNAFAFYVQSSITNPTSNYNDLYAPNAYVGYYSSLQTTLLDWQSASGLDPNSISINPNFVSAAAPFDLHVNESSPVDGAGIPIAGITTDFDGDTRHPSTPDIGADEFGVAGPPGMVIDLIITLSSSTDDSTNITLIWSPAENAQQYHIYKLTEPYGGFGLIGSTTDTTYTDTNAIISEVKSFYYVTSDNQ
jgi:parallel beta-helix repeat protein